MSNFKTHPLTVRVDSDVYKKIVKIAQIRGMNEGRLVTLTEILREAVEEKAAVEVKVNLV